MDSALSELPSSRSRARSSSALPGRARRPPAAPCSRSVSAGHQFSSRRGPTHRPRGAGGGGGRGRRTRAGSLREPTVLARGPLALLPRWAGRSSCGSARAQPAWRRRRDACRGRRARADPRSRVSPPAAFPAVRVLERVQLGPRHTPCCGGGGPPLPGRPRATAPRSCGGRGEDLRAVLLAAPFALPDRDRTRSGCSFSSRG